MIIQKAKNVIYTIYRMTKSTKTFSGLKQEEKNLIKSIRNRNLTYLSDEKILSIINTCNDIKSKNLSGIFIEAGCALGGSTILISKLKNTKTPFSVYDVFGMIPAPTEEDPEDVVNRYQTIVNGKSKGLGGNKYYGYEDNLYEIVQSNLKKYGVNIKEENIALIKGLLQDTMEIDQPVAFAHIDVDWYDPVKVSLERIFPNLVIGGSIILDDYRDWGGCKKATDEYLRKIEGQFMLDDTYSSLKITKIK